MKKYIFSALFTLLGLTFAQDLSFEEELRLLGADDFLIFEPVAPPPTTDAARGAQADSLAQAQTEDDALDADGEVPQNADMPANAHRGPPPAGGFSAMSPMGRQTAPDTSDAVRISVFDAAVVAQERSIDFSRNLTEYRSPQRALLFSLLVPGLGQAYNKNYWRTGLYAAIEIGMITGAVVFRKKARDVENAAKSFADENFDMGDLRNFYETLREFARAESFLDKADPKDSVTATAAELIFGFESIFGIDTSLNINQAIEMYMSEARNDFYGTSYGVGSLYGVRGWNDVAPRFTLSDLSIDTLMLGNDMWDFRINLPDGQRVFGTSANQRYFLDRMEESRKLGRRSSVFVVGIFMNHVASAADAFISAIIHNRKLLREEKGETPTKAQDILSRFSIESDIYFDGASDLTSRLGFVWRF